MSWRDVPPGVRIPYRERSEREREALQADLRCQAKQLVLARRGVVGAYTGLPDSRDGMLVNGDLVNMLLPSVRENPTLGLAALHEADMEVLVDLFQVFSWVEESALDRGVRRPILMTLGGQASGKTSMASFSEGVGAVLDAPHTDGPALVRRIEKLAGRGFEVWVAWVHRNPRHALQSMLLRAIEEGRAVRLSQMARAHHEAPSAFEAVGRVFRGQPRVSLFHVQNLGHPEDIQVLGGPLDREGKDALTVLPALPAWDEGTFFECLVKEFRGAMKGERRWAETPLPRDVVDFLAAEVASDTSIKQIEPRNISSRTLQASHKDGVPLAPLTSTLETPSGDARSAAGQLSVALKRGIIWNQQKLQTAFEETYGLAPSFQAEL